MMATLNLCVNYAKNKFSSEKWIVRMFIALTPDGCQDTEEGDGGELVDELDADEDDDAEDQKQDGAVHLRAHVREQKNVISAS